MNPRICEGSIRFQKDEVLNAIGPLLIGQEHAVAVERLAGLSNVYIHEFDREDIVRSGLVRNLLDRYECSA